MDTIRSCGCKGCRTCLICEKDYGVEKKDYYQLYQDLTSYVFCPDCNRLYKGWDVDTVLKNHSNHKQNDGIQFPGVLVRNKFLTENEGIELVQNLDKIDWQISQSGRRKQNFGPKTNFKKRKLQNGNFNGFPETTKFIQERFKGIPELLDFQTIEQCTLEYDSRKGASIDPHIDDCWIWGERVVTVNCLGDSVLTLVKYNGNTSKYNLDLVDGYRDKLMDPLLKTEDLELYSNMVIRIPMPNLSLIVLYGPARYQFEHAVLREDIVERRVCLAYREFTPIYLKNGQNFDQGNLVIEKACNFF